MYSGRLTRLIVSAHSQVTSLAYLFSPCLLSAILRMTNVWVCPTCLPFNAILPGSTRRDVLSVRARRSRAMAAFFEAASAETTVPETSDDASETAPDSSVLQRVCPKVAHGARLIPRLRPK